MSASKHETNRTVRDYLLEIANAGEMVSFEDRYFTDPEFLKLVEIEEERLIEDYLLGRLERNSRERFEEICQRDTSLAQKVEAVRTQLRLTTDKSRQSTRFWWYAFAFSATAACFFLIANSFFRKPSTRQLEAKVEVPAAEGFAELRLSPGVSKGVSQVPAVVLAGKDRLRVTLEMPGVQGPVSCKVKLVRIEADGGRSEIASSGVALSRPGANSEVTFTFERVRISRGDFLAELVTPMGAVLERYLFQAR